MMKKDNKYFIDINNEHERLRKLMYQYYKFSYPKRSDYKGWELYGRLRGLSWVLGSIEKVR